MSRRERETQSQQLAPRQLTDLLWLAAAPGAVLFAVLQVRGYWTAGTLGLDSHAYWMAARDWSSWYTLPVEYTDAYLYSPAFAQVLTPLGALPWPVFGLVWALAGLATLVWLVAPLGALRGAVCVLFFLPDILVGNIYSFLAAALVLSVHGHGEALVFPLLTKVLPSAVGLWHVIRREWGQVARLVGAAAAVIAVSYAVTPEAWGSWFDLLSRSGGERGWVLVRLVGALIVIVVAARGSRPWLLAPAMVLCSPLLHQFPVLAILAAIPRLLRWRGRELNAVSSTRLSLGRRQRRSPS